MKCYKCGCEYSTDKHDVQEFSNDFSVITTSYACENCETKVAAMTIGGYTSITDTNNNEKLFW